jgi:hypothetical protein
MYLFVGVMDELTQTTIRWSAEKLLLCVWHRTSVFQLPQKFHRIHIYVRKYIDIADRRIVFITCPRL